MLQFLLSEYKIALSCQFLCASTSDASGPFSWRGMKEELRFPTEPLLHSPSRCFARSRRRREQLPTWKRGRIRIWGNQRDVHSLLYLATQINRCMWKDQQQDAKTRAHHQYCTQKKENKKYPHILTIVLAAENVCGCWSRLTGAR